MWLRWGWFAGGLLALPALTACSGIGLGSVAVGASVVEADAGAVPEDGGTAPHFNGEPDAGGGRMTTPAATDVLGSPLCNVTAYSCNPDLAACWFNDLKGAGSGSCEPASSCSGAAVPVSAAACRVVQDADGGTQPGSECAPIGMKGEGESCRRSSDCEAQLDCVVAVPGAPSGVCRQYCCDLTCSGKGSFCDIEQVWGGGPLVPVCTEGESCTLLGSDCPSGESCTVVNTSTGQTACVTPGTGTAGSDCTKEKCGDNLACIDSKCKALCAVDDSYDCPSGEMCMALVALGANLGVCTTTK